ncbi:MAG: DUF420 domain-containing protein [Planctomycetota bacterium]|nr:DUF420 domain-containing protein [Planctomycetaceae bacterium]MDQ3329853.1 DUF420 domain-containing protein [Planctomycetota bacterium]
MPDWVSSLPAVNASLNALATVLLLVGYAFIRNGKVIAHRNTMLSSFGVSIVFLACYLVYHAYAGSKSFPSVPYAGVREAYLAILLTHVVLAAAVPVLAVVTIWRALVTKDFEKHKRIARITFPIWLYVSVTGVIIYGMLYHLAPALVAD